MTTSEKSVLIAGGTGMLGAQIGHSILDEGGSVRLLLREARPSDAKKADTVAALTARGVEIVIGELSDKASLERATRGVDSVVSALQGGPDVIVDGQIALAEAAAANGVRRFILQTSRSIFSNYPTVLIPISISAGPRTVQSPSSRSR